MTKLYNLLVLIVTGIAILISFIYFTEWGSLGSLLGVTGVSVVQMIIYLLKYANSAVNAYMVCAYLIIFALNLLTWGAHHQNIVRLFAGEEHHTSIKKLAKKK